jgi:hypothetical protein
MAKQGGHPPCPHCGESFEPARANQAYCTPRCRTRAREQRKDRAKSRSAARKAAAPAEESTELAEVTPLPADDRDRPLLSVLNESVDKMTWLKDSDNPTVELCRKYCQRIDDAATQAEEAAEIAWRVRELAEGNESDFRSLLKRLEALEKAVNPARHRRGAGRAQGFGGIRWRRQQPPRGAPPEGERATGAGGPVGSSCSAARRRGCSRSRGASSHRRRPPATRRSRSPRPSSAWCSCRGSDGCCCTCSSSTRTAPSGSAPSSSSSPARTARRR